MPRSDTARRRRTNVAWHGFCEDEALYILVNGRRLAVTHSSGLLRSPRTFVGFACGLLLMASTVTASPLTLTPVITLHQFQQTTNNPCVIGDPSCDNGSFPETILPGGATSYDAFSPIYQTTGVVAAGSFQIGVDINQSNETQRLSLFQLIVNGNVVDSFIGTQTGCTQPSTNCQDVPPTAGGGNGNGFADYLLSGFSAIPAGAQVQFHVVMPLVNSGREEF